MSSLTALYKDLLFTHGHVADVALATSLSASAPESVAPTWSPAMNFFKSLMYLGGLESLDPHIHEPRAPEAGDAFGPTYGNAIASAQAFGAPRTERSARDTAPRGALPAGCG